MPKPRSWAGTHTGGWFEKTVRPSILMVPESGVSRPATARSSVVLPDPLAPMMTKNSPASTSRLRLLRAATLPSVTTNSL